MQWETSGDRYIRRKNNLGRKGKCYNGRTEKKKKSIAFQIDETQEGRAESIEETLKQAVFGTTLSLWLEGVFINGKKGVTSRARESAE